MTGIGKHRLHFRVAQSGQRGSARWQGWLLRTALPLCIGCQPPMDTDGYVKQMASQWPPYQAPTTAEGFEAPGWSPMHRKPRPPVRPTLDKSIQEITPHIDWNLEETALDALARIGQPAVPELVKALDNEDPRVRYQAAEVIGRIGPEAEDAVDALVQTVGTDQDQQVRKAAVRALGQIGSRAAEAVEPLMKLIGVAADQPPAL